jgi:nucleoside-triphosphatase THEP1
MPGDLLPHLLALLEEGREGACVILSGGIGAGKTRAAERLAFDLEARGFTVAGVLSRRILRDQKTVGYTIRDLSTGKEHPFARLEPPGVAVGKFFVDEAGLAAARDAIARGAKTAEAVFVDEVGRLELNGGGLAPAVRMVLESTALSVLLVRSEFVDPVVKAFSIRRATVIPVEEEARPIEHRGELG